MIETQALLGTVVQNSPKHAGFGSCRLAKCIKVHKMGQSALAGCGWVTFVRCPLEEGCRWTSCNEEIRVRLVVVGNGAFAVPMFEAVCESRHEVVGVLTRPAPGTRSRRPPPRPVWQAAVQRGCQVYEPSSINEPPALEWLEKHQPDLLVVCDYGEILRRAVLELARLGGINLHGSLLPKYRGAAPVAWAILQGETRTGVTVIRMTPKLDAGPILVQRVTDIGSDETTPELEARLARMGADAVLEAIQILETWDGHSPLGIPQDSRLATSAPRLTRAMGLIDWTASAHTIRNRVRAMIPWPGSYTWWVSSGERSTPLRLILHKVQAIPADSGSEPGTVLDCSGGTVSVQAGDQSAVLIEQLQPEGGRRMSSQEFVRGYPIRPGDRLTGEPAAHRLEG